MQEFDDYELILSDDHSIDGTAEYIDGIRGERIKAFHTVRTMSMAEHWEWALSKAEGRWAIFVGQDDGLQPYFFRLAERLSDIADESGIRAIMSRRAYYCWPECDPNSVYATVSYTAVDSIGARSFAPAIVSTLLGLQDYFELPQMYTTSLFHRDLLDEARRRQGGVVFTTHPQDANLAAIALSLERKYLYSDIPLGWVGSSSRSAGLAVVSKSDPLADELKTEYVRKTKQSGLRYCSLIGDFSIGSTVLYFWGALLETSQLRARLIDLILRSRFARRIVLSAAYLELCEKGEAASTDRVSCLREAVVSNGFDYSYIKSFARRQLACIRELYRLALRTFNRTTLGFDLVFARTRGRAKKKSISLFIHRVEEPGVSLSFAQSKVMQRMAEENFFQE